MTVPELTAPTQHADDGDQALVARVVSLLHTSGESTSVTLDTADRLNRRLGTTLQVIPEWTSTTVISNRRDAVTTIAPPLGVSMGAVTIAVHAVDAFTRMGLSRGDLMRELDRAAHAAPSRLWFFVLACASGSAALSIIFGAQDATAVVLVAISAAIGGVIRRMLGRAHVGPLGQVFAAALLAGIIGGIAVDANLSSALRLIAVCPAMILVPGPHILNGVLDLFALRIPLGGARLAYAGVLLLAIGSGLALGLALLGTDLPVEPVGRTVPLWLDVLAAAVAAASYPVYFAIPSRLIVWPVVVGAIAHGLRTWVMNDLGWNVAIGATLACCVVGIVFAPVSHRLHIPFAAVAFAAVVALVPGVYVFRMIDGLADLAFGSSAATLTGAISDGTVAVLIVLGMAVGLAVPKHVYGQVAARREHAR
jgi:uncharacterized membrane protein YjjP (DUF1212 family)